MTVDHWEREKVQYTEYSEQLRLNLRENAFNSNLPDLINYHPVCNWLKVYLVYLWCLGWCCWFCYPFLRSRARAYVCVFVWAECTENFLWIQKNRLFRFPLQKDMSIHYTHAIHFDYYHWYWYPRPLFGWICVRMRELYSNQNTNNVIWIISKIDANWFGLPKGLFLRYVCVCVRVTAWKYIHVSGQPYFFRHTHTHHTSLYCITIFFDGLEIFGCQLYIKKNCSTGINLTIHYVYVFVYTLIVFLFIFGLLSDRQILVNCSLALIL